MNQNKIKTLKSLFYINTFIFLVSFMSYVLGIYYGVIITSLIFVMIMIGNLCLWNSYISLFPRNRYQEYSFDVVRDRISVDIFGNYYIDIYKVGSIYKCSINNKDLIFNMKECFCPKTMICAFFIRQFQFETINTYKLPSSKMISNIYIAKKFEYQTLVIRFHNGDKIKKIKIIDGYRTKMNIIMKNINGTSYYKRSPYSQSKYCGKMSERDFWRKKE
ncbi:MAG: hypothetical protein IJA65_00635 [Acholeplasmatales bacterium]|nr:hypothetical protein [Acholeplasmatales bacterium]